jgi:hypothetical protein
LALTHLPIKRIAAIQTKHLFFLLLSHHSDIHQHIQSMTATNPTTQCFTCKNEPGIFTCEGCSQRFGRDCLPKHLDKLDTDLEQLKNDHDQFRETLNRQKQNPNEYSIIKDSIIKEIDQWEEDSINKIKHTANECREQVINHINNEYFIEIEKKLNDIAKQLEAIRGKNQFNEINLNRLTENLNKLKEELANPSSIKIQQDSLALVQKISIVIGKFLI